MSKLIDRVVAKTHADTTRVYLTGFSLDGFLALDFACAHPEMIAAAVSVSGTRFLPTTRCAAGSVSTLHVHGEQDTTVAPAGGVGRRTGARYLSARAAATLAASAAGCARAMAAAGVLDSGARVERASDCRGGAKVELWMLPGMGHAPPDDASFTAAIWGFLEDAGRAARSATAPPR